MYPLKRPGALLKRFGIARAPHVVVSNQHDYETLYESHAQYYGDDRAVGAGEFELIGRLERQILEYEGLRRDHTLLDFGCGNGRLAIHAIPSLTEGRYIGTDISKTFLQRADERIRASLPRVSCQINLLHQNSARFPVADQSVDMMCAFSVFTHVEHEDTYHYLCDARRVVRPGGRFIYSCMPLNLSLSKHFFLAEAAMPLDARWHRVRSVATSVDMMEELSRMAGWKVLRWYAGDEQNIELPGGGKHALGQSCCVLEAP